MRDVLEVGEDVKARRARVRGMMSLSFGKLEMALKLQLIQGFISLGLMHIGEVLKEEVRVLADKRYKRNGLPSHVGWAEQQPEAEVLGHSAFGYRAQVKENQGLEIPP